jgi:SAM-dependent methyltransferase
LSPNWNIEDLQARFGLSYHVPFALRASQLGFKGKRVLEVGGSLPRPFVLDVLEARQWVAIEEMDYWQESQSTGHRQGTPPAQMPTRTVDSAADADTLGDYEVLKGAVENRPSGVFESFDVVFSIAAFEHIGRLPMALDRMHKALRKGGELFTLFAPIWSAHDGHHLPNIVDRSGKAFGFHSSPIPPWGHLMMRPPELYQHLQNHTDKETAAEIVYFVYHSPHINRLFTEDYIKFFQGSDFAVRTVELAFLLPDSDALENMLRTIENIYPGRKHFRNNGILAVLTKD